MWHRVERAPSMTQSSTPTLKLHDIQGIILRDRPVPYFGAYLLLRIDNPADGCSLLRRLAPRVASGISWQDHTDTAWFNVAFTFEGLMALSACRGPASRASPPSSDRAWQRAPSDWET